VNRSKGSIPGIYINKKAYITPDEPRAGLTITPAAWVLTNCTKFFAGSYSDYLSRGPLKKNVDRSKASTPGRLINKKSSLREIIQSSKRILDKCSSNNAAFQEMFLSASIKYARNTCKKKK
jgi:hypothetical protein